MGLDESSKVSCSICLEPVTDNGDRSWAKLQCGHEFHLDCIGSAFNIKGAMQCPNCRKVEKGQWLFSAGCRSFTDGSFEDWPHDEDIYDMSYSEVSFGVQWCPFTTFPRLAEDDEFQSTSYHNLLGPHPVFAEQTPVSSSSHPCPYVAYYGPVHSSSSNSLESASEVPPSYTYPPMHQSWDHHVLPVSAIDTRLSGSDQPSLPSMTHRPLRPVPFVATPRAGSSVNSSMVQPYPGSAARARDRAQALQAYSQPPSGSGSVSGGSRRSNSHNRGPSSSDRLNMSAPPTWNFLEPENQIPSRVYPWERDHHLGLHVERDSGWGGFHHPAGGPSSGFRQWHYGPERTPSQNRS